MNMNRKCRHGGLLLSAIWMLGSAGAAVAAPVFIPLPDLAGGLNISVATSVTAYGHMAAGFAGSAASAGSNGFEATRWTISGNSATATRLGDLAGSSFDSLADGISADGAIVVGEGHSTSSGSSQTEGLRWTALTGAQGLGDLPGTYSYGFYSSAKDISDDGSVIVGQSDSNLGLQAAKWTASGIEPINGLEDATGASANGSVIVGTGVDGIARRVVGTQVQSLGYLHAAKPFSAANGVSSDGRVVIGTSGALNVLNEATVEAFRWENGVMQSLGALTSDSSFRSVATSVSADGEVVVGNSAIYYFGQDRERAFIWDAEHGMRNLQSVLNDLGTTGLANWTLLGAEDISADGRTIVGWGRNGVNYAGWLVRLDAPLGSVLEEDQVAQLVTGSPVSLNQMLLGTTPTEGFTLGFDYRFTTAGGTLTVTLADELLATLTPDGDVFRTVNFAIDASHRANLLGRSNPLLQFRLEGPTGSTVLLDNILLPGLANGDFQATSLFGWSVVASDGGGVMLGVAPAPVPLPPAWLAMLGGIGLLWRRRATGKQASPGDRIPQGAAMLLARD